MWWDCFPASHEQPDTTSLSLGDDPEDETSTQLNSANLLLDAVGDEQQNGNNNNNPCKFTFSIFLPTSKDPYLLVYIDKQMTCG